MLRLRHRLTYGNVVATLALFLALTGSAAAVGKYIVSTDVIPSGDLAGSTYGDPVIADGKVNSVKIADGAITSSKLDSSAIAPDANRLDGLDSTSFPMVVARGSFSLVGFPTLAPGGCTVMNQTLGASPPDPPTFDVTSDVPVVVRVEGVAFQVTGSLLVTKGLPPNLYVLSLQICNRGIDNHAPNGTYRYVILR